MTCRPCTGHHAATLARAEHPGPVHVHYDAIDDTFVVLRADENTHQ
jgi:hypothetical protein